MSQLPIVFLRAHLSIHPPSIHPSISYYEPLLSGLPLSLVMDAHIKVPQRRGEGDLPLQVDLPTSVPHSERKIRKEGVQSANQFWPTLSAPYCSRAVALVWGWPEQLLQLDSHSIEWIIGAACGSFRPFCPLSISGDEWAREIAERSRITTWNCVGWWTELFSLFYCGCSFTPLSPIGLSIPFGFSLAAAWLRTSWSLFVAHAIYNMLCCSLSCGKWPFVQNRQKFPPRSGEFQPIDVTNPPLLGPAGTRVSQSCVFLSLVAISLCSFLLPGLSLLRSLRLPLFFFFFVEAVWILLLNQLRILVTATLSYRISTPNNQRQSFGAKITWAENSSFSSIYSSIEGSEPDVWPPRCFPFPLSFVKR
jgi:hypothetical protein